MRNASEVTCVHALSAQMFLRIEWTPGWSIFIRQVLAPLALLAALLLGGATDGLDVILEQLLH